MVPSFSKIRESVSSLTEIDPNISREDAVLNTTMLVAGSILSLEGVFGLMQDAKSNAYGFAIMFGGLAIAHAGTQLRGGYFRDTLHEEVTAPEVEIEDSANSISDEEREAWVNRPLSIEELLADEPLDVAVGGEFVESTETLEDLPHVVNLNDYRRPPFFRGKEQPET